MPTLTDSGSSPLQDYLHEYVSNGLKRELDFEEAVWRTLPAFVTALGFLGTAASFLLREIVRGWTLAHDWLPGTLLLAGSAAIVTGAWHLRFAVKSRGHYYPLDEVRICSWAAELQVAAGSAGADATTVELETLNTVRAEAVRQTAIAASWNHLANAQKLKGRTRAARWLFIAAVFMLMTHIAQVFSESQTLETATMSSEPAPPPPPPPPPPSPPPAPAAPPLRWVEKGNVTPLKPR